MFDPNRYGNPGRRRTARPATSGYNDKAGKSASEQQVASTTQLAVRSSSAPDNCDTTDLKFKDETSVQNAIEATKSNTSHHTEEDSQDAGVALGEDHSLPENQLSPVIAEVLPTNAPQVTQSLENIKVTDSKAANLSDPSSEQRGQNQQVEQPNNKLKELFGPKARNLELENASDLLSIKTQVSSTPASPRVFLHDQGLANTPQPQRKVSPRLDPNKTPEQNHDAYMKWYRTLTPEEKSEVLRAKAEESTAQIGHKILHPDKSATVSWQTLQLARKTPNLDEVMPAHGISTCPTAADTGPSATESATEDNNRNVNPSGNAIELTVERGMPTLPYKPSPLRNAVRASPHSSNKINSPMEECPDKGNKWIKSKATKPKLTASDDEIVNSDLHSGSVSEPHSCDSPSKPMGYGKLFRKRDLSPAEPDRLANWDGTLAPPPESWYTRIAFNNNSLEFRDYFDNWLERNTTMTTELRAANELFVPTDSLLNADLHPDGINLVQRHFMIDSENCLEYGFGTETLEEIRNSTERLVPDDFEDWGKVDPRDEFSAQHNHETVHLLCRNLNFHKMIEERKRFITIEQLRKSQTKKVQELADTTAVDNIRANIYVRPAKRYDMKQLVEIYNYYIANSPRTTEMDKIDEQAMIDRLFTSYHDKLPFLVALSKRPNSKKPRKAPAAIQQMHSEKIVGYVLAQDFSGMMLAEKYSSELELYVHHDWMRKGVGRALLDKALEVCDGGYLPRQGYWFECDSEISHMYSAGGQRDLISLIFVVRHYHNLRRNEAHDYAWIKNWLADYGFEEQGLLQACAVKHGRL